MEINRSKIDGIEVLAVEGDVNMYNSQDLRKTFQEMLKEKVEKLLVDLSASAYIDSSCLATLIEMQQKTAQMGSIMYISGVSGKVKNIFEVSKVDSLFKIFASKEEALKEMA